MAMTMSRLGTAVYLCTSLSYAFQNTSPFFAFSNKHNAQPSSISNFVKAEDLHGHLTSHWIDCEATDVFFVISQAGVDAADFATRRASPYLQHATGNTAEYHSLVVPDVIGPLASEDLVDVIQAKCALAVHQLDPTAPLNIPEAFPQLLSMDFPAPPREDAMARSNSLKSNDEALNTVLQTANGKHHVVFFTTTPSQSSSVHREQHLAQHKHSSHSQPGLHGVHHSESLLDYDSEDHFSGVVHMDMKRDMSSYPPRNEANGTSHSAGLFERYNFLNHGVFMGGLVVAILLSILYVGLTAIGSIEITAFAFSKEMGPSGQKKQN